MKTCVYCDEIKETRVWKETGENVCYDCRSEFLDEEFKPKTKYVLPELERMQEDMDAFFGQIPVLK